MALRSALARQLGMVLESGYAVAGTPDLFLPLVSNGLDADIVPIESAAQIVNRLVLDSTQWSQGAVKAGGDVGFELYDRAIDAWLKLCLGSTVTTGAGPYTHTHTPGDLAGISATLQAGEPDTGGTVRSFTYPGSKAASWELAWKEGANATFGVTAMSKTEWEYRVVADGATTNATKIVTSATAAFSPADVGSPITGTGIPASTTIASVESPTSITLSANATATAAGLTVTIGVALAAATTPAGLIPFKYIHASVLVAGASQKVIAGKLAGDNKLEERRFGGQATTDEPYSVEQRAYTGELEIEFSSLAMRDRFRSGVESALVVAFAAGSKTLTATCNVRYDKAKREYGGRGLGKLKMPFKCVGATDAQALTIVTVNSDSTP